MPSSLIDATESGRSFSGRREWGRVQGVQELTAYRMAVWGNGDLLVSLPVSSEKYANNEGHGPRMHVTCILMGQ